MKPDITIITHAIKPGQNKYFELWLHGIIKEAIKFKGYQGINIISPFDEKNEYTLTIRFDEKRNRLKWESSNIRKQWILKLNTMIIKEGTVHYESGVDFWFSSPLTQSITAPKWKMALITWSTVFILICTLTLIINNIVPHIHLLLRLFLMTIIMTLSLTYIIMPRLTKLFNAWLFKGREL